MRTNSARAHKSEEGKVLILALILLVVGTLLITPLLGFMSTGLTAGQVYENKTAELYAADAGVMDAIWKIQSGNITAPTGCDNDPVHWPYRYDITDHINDKNVSIEVHYVGDDTFRITSNATDENGSGTTIESYVSYGSEWGELLDFGLIALEGDIDIKNTVVSAYPEEFLCHIYAKGHITIDKSQVYGSATATGTVTIEGPKAILDPGPPRSGLSPPLEFTLPDIDRYLSEAEAGGVIGSQTITESQTLGPVRISGNLQIEGNAVVTLGGPVWVDGKVKATGTASIEGKGPLVAVGELEVAGTDRPAPDEMPVLISTEDTIVTTGTGKIYAVLYAPNAKISVTGNAGVNGAIIAKAISLSASTETRYDLTVVDRVRVPGLKIHTWEIK